MAENLILILFKQGFEMGSMAEIPILLLFKQARQGEHCSCSNNSCPHETNPIPCADKESPLWNKNGQCY